jgi:putative NADH-flavin reductase
MFIFVTKKPMKIAILGATGRTGQCLLKLALVQGHEVRVLVRDASKLGVSHQNLSVVEGSPTNKEKLSETLDGVVAVLSTLNISRTSDFPWATLRTPNTFLSDVAQHLVALCSQKNISRIIITTAWGVADTKKNIPAWFRFLIDNSNIGIAYQDHEKQEHLFEVSTLNYTMVRPAGLTNFGLKPNIKVSYQNSPRPSLMISRQSVANFMLSIIDNPQFFKKMPVISN